MIYKVIKNVRQTILKRNEDREMLIFNAFAKIKCVNLYQEHYLIRSVADYFIFLAFMKCCVCHNAFIIIGMCIYLCSLMRFTCLNILYELYKTIYQFSSYKFEMLNKFIADHQSINSNFSFEY